MKKSLLLAATAVVGAGVAFQGSVNLQATTPGTPQNGHSNVSGTSKAGFFQGNGSLLTNLNASALNTGIITLTGISPTYIIRGTNDSSAANATGLIGIANSPTGNTYGGWFESKSVSGRALFGYASATTGATYATYAVNNSNAGRACFGTAVSPTGTTYGGFFTSLSSQGRGVYGQASAASGTTYGVYGKAISPTGFGVYSEGNLHATGTISGIVRADNPSTSDLAYAVHAIMSAPEPGAGASALRGETAGSGFGVWGSNSGDGRGVYGTSTAGTGVFGSSSAGHGVHGLSTSASGIRGESGSGYGVYGMASGTSGANFGVHGQSASSTGVGVNGIASSATGVSYGVYGASASPSGYGIYSQGRAKVAGSLTVEGRVDTGKLTTLTDFIGSPGAIVVNDPNPSVAFGATRLGLYAESRGAGANATGVLGRARATDVGDVSIGVHGFATGAGGNYGVYGAAISGTTNWAGYFSGSLFATTANSGIKNFMIDHPMDPANKVLMHSSIEGEERMNLYRGIVKTDAQGYATVTMPSYFDALNEDIQYQVSVIDEADSADFVLAKVVQKLRNGKFKIRTSVPGTEVHWQVSGRRHDPTSEFYPLEVERMKNKDEKGKYYAPEAYGKDKSLGMGYMPTQEAPAKPKAKK